MKNKLLGQSAIYLFGGALNKAIPFLLLPIITKYLSPAEYGQLSIFLVLISVYLSFIGMNIQLNISRHFHKASMEELSTIVSSILVIVTGMALIFSGFTWFLSPLIVNILGTFDGWLLWIPVLVLFQMLIVVNTTILRNEGRPFTFAFYEVGQTLLVLSITIVFLVYQSAGWSSQVRGLLIGYFIVSLMSLARTFRQGYITFKIDKDLIKKLLSVSIPLIPHSLGIIVIAISDRLFIKYLVNLEAVGLYAIGYSFGTIVNIFSDSFIKAWSPWFYKQLSAESIDNKNDIVRYTYLYIVAIFTMAMIISLVGKFLLPYLVDDRYLGANEFIMWVALAYAIRGVYQIFFPYLVYFGKTKELAYSTIAAATCNLVLNYFLIGWWGAIGAAYSTAISLALSAFLVIMIQSKLIEMPWTKIRPSS